MICVDVSSKATGLSFWVPRRPLFTCQVRAYGKSGFITIFQPVDRPRKSCFTGDVYPDMATAVVGAIITGSAHRRRLSGKHDSGADLNDAFLIEDGYVGRNKRDSLNIADMRGRIANALCRQLGMAEMPRVLPDTWRESVSKTIAPGLVWPKQRAEKKAMMVEVAKRTWPDLPRSECLTDDEADSLGLGNHHYACSGYFEK